MYRFIIHLKSGNKVEFENEDESYDELANWYTSNCNLHNGKGVWAVKNPDKNKVYKIPFDNVEFVESYKDD